MLTLTLERLAQEVGYGIPEGETGVLAQSLPDWPAFDEVPNSLARASPARLEPGDPLELRPGPDRRLEKRLGVPFDLTIVAEDVRSYKPAHAHWERFFEATTADRDRHVHVAQSHFHDIVPANELGLTSVWINRLGEQGEPAPTREIPDLSSLPDVLDELVPPA